MERLPYKEREPFLHLRYGRLDVKDNALVLEDKKGTRMQIPAGAIASLMLEPGMVVTHAAVKLCAEEDCLMIWCGEGGVRFYATGAPGGARSDKLLFQLGLSQDPKKRLMVVREMFRRRFGEDGPDRRSVEQLRGLEGARVREQYQKLADAHGVVWRGRNYDTSKWLAGDEINRAISAANACVYGVSEAAILVAGYSPAIGFLHSGRPLSFVYDVADLYKFELSVPVAFAVVAERKHKDIEGAVRRRLRDVFKAQRIMAKIIPDIENILGVAE
ncbi:MAG: type I-E CRISPR-associated endonuclease Cas1e [Deltaproteobacteria bacterium]|nr:type I-E CRISPR-associated endonuclease Cas1e [Deltaproteobacteria bacterium]